MPLYRIHRPLDVGNEIIPRDSIASVNGALGDTSCVPNIRLKPKSIEALIVKGAISRLGVPPLEVLAGWKKRAAKCEPHGIRTIEDFIEASNMQLAEIFSVKTETASSWKEELLAWVLISNSPQGRKAKG